MHASAGVIALVLIERVAGDVPFRAGLSDRWEARAKSVGARTSGGGGSEACCPERCMCVYTVSSV
ncbi:MAG: hypothetical protein KC766_12515 [Myxococcales bacterium]|nr:hypothetical protein [Myxococcales bacterium]